MRLQIASLFLSCLVGGALFAACSNQAEGQRCDPRFGNDDCQDGLVCKRASELGGVYDICCPAAGANVVECRRSISVDGGDTPAPDATAPDAATTSDAGVSDATLNTDATVVTDAAADAISDAATDAAGDQ